MIIVKNIFDDNECYMLYYINEEGVNTGYYYHIFYKYNEIEEGFTYDNNDVGKWYKNKNVIKNSYLL